MQLKKHYEFIIFCQKVYSTQLQVIPVDREFWN